MRQKQVWLLRSVIAAALSMASAAFAAGKITVISAPDGGQAMAAKVDASGTIHLAFQSASGPQYARSTDGGKTFSKAIPIVDRASEKPGLEFTVWDMYCLRSTPTAPPLVVLTD